MKVDIYSYFIGHRGSEKLSSLSEVIKPLDGKNCQHQTQSSLISSSALSPSIYPGTLQFWYINRAGRFCMEWYFCLKININMPVWNPPPLAWSFFFPMKNLIKQYFRLWRSRILFLATSSNLVPIKWNCQKDIKSACEIQQQCVFNRYIPVGRGKIQNTNQRANADEDIEQQEFSSIPRGNSTWYSHFGR